jgi:hypothetical protein
VALGRVGKEEDVDGALVVGRRHCPHWLLVARGIFAYS